MAIASKNVDIVSANKKLMNSENVIIVHSKNKLLNIWTLDTTVEIKTAIKLNIDSYFTDYTAKAFLLQKQYRNR